MARTLRWRADNPAAAFSARLKSLYNITADDYAELLAAQGGCCALCERTAEGSEQRRLHVDHDHDCCPDKTSCGKCVRGLLCNTCNRLLGWVDARRDRIQTYLEKAVA